MLKRFVKYSQFRNPKFRTNKPIILLFFSPKLVSYELHLALICFVNTGPDG